MPTERWSDDRLDELNRRVIGVEGVKESVAVMKNDMASVKRGQDRIENAVGKLSTKLGEVVDEPLVRARDFRRQILQGALAAACGGVIVVLITLALGALH